MKDSTAKEKKRRSSKKSEKLEKPDFDWSNVHPATENPTTEKPEKEKPKLKTKKSKKKKSSSTKKRKSRSSSNSRRSTLERVSETSEFHHEEEEQQTAESTLAPNNGTANPDGAMESGYKVPTLANSRHEARRLSSLLGGPPTPQRTLSSADDSFISESGWSDAVSSSGSEGEY